MALYNSAISSTLTQDSTKSSLNLTGFNQQQTHSASRMKRNQSGNRDYDDKSQLSMIHETISSHSKTQDNSVLGRRAIELNRSNLNIQNFRDTQISNQEFNPHISTTIKLLGDKEKFIYAKCHSHIGLLLELIQSNDQINNRTSSLINLDRNGSYIGFSGCGGQYAAPTKTNNYFQTKIKTNQTSYNNLLQSQGLIGGQAIGIITTDNNNSQKLKNKKDDLNGYGVFNAGPQFMNHQLSRSNSQMNSSFNQNPGELRSDLRKDWLDQENLVSHCAINQLTYIILQKRKEIKLLKFYNQQDQYQKQEEFIKLRKNLIQYFEEHKTVEKRLQKYQLMADDTGIQSGLFFLLAISDDEIKGISNDPSLNAFAAEYRSSISSSSSLDRGKATSILSQTSKYNTNKKKVETKKIMKEFKTGWFKKNINYLINTVDQVLSDHSFSLNTNRIALILMSNLHLISKSATKSYTKKKLTYQKILRIFEIQRDTMTEDELIEIEKALMLFYSKREIYQITKRKAFITKQKEVYTQNILSPYYADNPGEYRPSKLIRSDSVESLIEQINTDKQYRSMMQGNQLLDLSNTNTHTDFNDDTGDGGKKVINSYEFKMLTEDRVLDRQLSPHESQEMEFNQQVRTTGSVGNEMRNIIIRAMNGRKNKQPSQFQGNRSPDLNTSNNNSDTSKFEEIRYKGYNYQPKESNNRNQSKYSKRNHIFNDSNLKDSKLCGSPLADTFLDLKDSLIARDKSFYQRYLMDQSREDFKQMLIPDQTNRTNNESVAFTKNSSVYNKNNTKSQLQSGARRASQYDGQSQGQIYRDNKSFNKVLNKEIPEFQEYENLDVRNALKITDKSTHIDNKKFLNSKGGLEKSLNKSSKIFIAQNQGCCSCFGTSRNNNIRRSTMKNTVLITKQSEEFKGSEIFQNKISIKSSLKEQIILNRQALQITSDDTKSILCPHNKNISMGEKCKRCSQSLKMKRVLTQEESSTQESCNIF